MENASAARVSRRNVKLLILSVGTAIIAAYAITKLYRDRQFQSEISQLTEILELKPGMVVGEIGAGEGKMTVATASKVGPKGHVFSTEIDPKRIEKIRQAVREAKLDNVTVVPASTQETGLPENCCDAVFMRGVYHHLTQPSDIDKSLWKAIRPDGRLAIIDFPPKLFLWPWRPKEVPKNRGGHGIPQGILIDEVTSADFQVVRVIDNWPGGRYCVLFRKPTQILITMGRDRANPFVLPNQS